MRVLAPAKVNLFLRIVGVRDDGYHLLDSLMIPVGLCDEIQLTVQKVRNAGGSQIIVRCDEPSIPNNETNLAYRAAALICQDAGVSVRMTIEIEKRIPAGAGLGGGSSDAAAVLTALNVELGLHWPAERLGALAVRLGADVPFFIRCQPARVGGIGEELTPITLPFDRWFVLVVPPFEVSTPWAYRRFDELPAEHSASANPAFSHSGGGWPRPEQYINDLERAVIPSHPVIQTIKAELLTRQAEAALMSGSGSAVFGVFRDQAAAKQAALELARQGRTFCVKAGVRAGWN